MAITRTKGQGFSAKMELGISAEACLWVDLGIAPSNSGGNQSFQASQFMFFYHLPTAIQQGQLRIDRAISDIFVSEYSKALDDLHQAETLVTSTDLLASVYSYRATVYVGIRDYDKMPLQ